MVGPAWRNDMQRLAWVAFMATLTACGWYGDQEEDKPARNTADADGVVSVPGPAGRDGVDGTDGTTGPEGATGKPGDDGLSIQLFDAAGQGVGFKFNDGDPADVFLLDGKRALFDMTTGALRAPLFNFFCMYPTNDCSGACYVYDYRWLNVVIADLDGETFVAARGTAASPSMTMESYVRDDGMCMVQSILTDAPYLASAYEPTITLPLAAPLYWGLTQ